MSNRLSFFNVKNRGIPFTKQSLIEPFHLLYKLRFISPRSRGSDRYIASQNSDPNFTNIHKLSRVPQSHIRTYNFTILKLSNVCSADIVCATPRGFKLLRHSPIITWWKKQSIKFKIPEAIYY